MSAHNPDRRAAVDAITCLECRAPAGEDCRTAHGAAKWPPHKVRLDNHAEIRRNDEIERMAGKR